MLVSELYEDVFEARSERSYLCDGNAVFQKLVAKIVEIATVFDKRMDGLPENGGAADTGNLAREAKCARDFGRGDFHAEGALRLNVGKLPERIGCAIGDKLAEINVGDVAATLSLVHVVRGNKKRDAVAGELEEQIPELAPSNGVDTGGGLVEEKKSRLVQHGAAEGETLLPASGKLRGQAVQIRFEAVELDNFVDAPL